MKKVKLDLQIISTASGLPERQSFLAWVKAALEEEYDNNIVELTIRLVDEPEMTKLNETYRGKTGPTNVLSFPFEQPAKVDMPVPLLGDIVICAPLVKKEAALQGKSSMSHWAHLVVHGCLHLLGLDHQTDKEAEKMEAKEIIILKKLHIENPYQQDVNV